MMTPTQCRMARAGLRWSVEDLAVHAGVSEATVIRFENGQGRPIRATVTTLQAAMERGGIEFVGGDGVRLPIEGRGEAREASAPAVRTAPVGMGPGAYDGPREVVITTQVVGPFTRLPTASQSAREAEEELDRYIEAHGG